MLLTRKPTPFAPNYLRDTFVNFFLLLCFLLWELYPLDPQIFYVFQILYIRFTPYTFSLFNLIMA